MKKIFLIISLIITVMCTKAFAEDISVKLNGSKLIFDQPPIIADGRTLVPMRAIFEALGLDVKWDNDTRQITASNDHSAILLTVDSTNAIVNDITCNLDVPPQIINDRTLVPARFVAESLNCKVNWHPDTQTVVINKIYSPLPEEAYNINLYVPEGNIYGKYTDFYGYNGTNEIYFRTSLINVESYDKIYFTTNRAPATARFVTAYDENMYPLADKSGENLTETDVSGVSYLIVSFNNIYKDTLVISPSTKADVFLPEEICIAAGKNITIYNRNIVSKNHTDYNFTWQCEKGTSTVDGYSIKATNADIGTYKLQLDVTNNHGDMIFSGHTNVKIVKNTVKKTSVLPIGDAHTNNKSWLETIIRSSANRITFVGTRGISPRCHEGRSDFSSVSYLNNTEYKYEKEGVHPFWDGERFNWNHYKKKALISPHAVQIFLGTNGMAIDPRKNADAIRTMVEYIRNDDPTIPIFVVNTIYRGTVYNTDGTEDIQKNTELHISGFNLAEYLTSILSGFDNVHIIPAYATFNTLANYKESNSVNPTDSGYEQLSDIIYSTYCAYLN